MLGQRDNYTHWIKSRWNHYYTKFGGVLFILFGLFVIYITLFGKPGE
jgi:hypothetical protein